jgi:predicted alpha/beta superfamily hydrolase
MLKIAKSVIITWALALIMQFLPTTATSVEDGEDIIIGKYQVIHSEILGEDRSLSIYVPYGYEESDERYPVIYSLDGQSSIRLMKVASVMEELEVTKMPKAIVVGVHVPNARRDYWPVPSPQNPNTGQADNFIRFFSEELLPWIDGNYRTVDYRILYGASNSGFFTSYTMLTQPDLFSAYIAASPSIGWETEFMVGLADSLFGAGGSYDTYLFMNYATDDLERIVTSAMPAWKEVFETKAPDELKWELRVMEKAGHVPYVSVHDGLLFIFSNWEYTKDQIESGGLAGVREHYAQLSKQYGFPVKMSGSVLTDLAMIYFRAEEWTAAIEVFDVYQAEYPTSARAPYYLAETYLRSTDTTNARLWFEKTLEIDSTFTAAKRKLEALGS